MGTETITRCQPRHQFFSPRRVSAIAGNTLRELIRQKVFYFLLIFGLGLIGFSVFLLTFKFHEQFQMLKDVSLGAISLFTWLLAVLTTAMLLPKDIEDRTLYTILAKPVPRIEYLMGKLCGVFMLLLISTAVMGALFVAILYGREQWVIADIIREAGTHATPAQIAEKVNEIKALTFTWSLVPCVAAIYLKAALLATLTLMISTFASSWIFTIVISVAAYLIGNIEGIARDYYLTVTGGSAVTEWLMGGVALMFPDLQLFNLVDDAVAGNAIPTLLFLKTAALGLAQTAFYFCLAWFGFAKKEL